MVNAFLWRQQASRVARQIGAVLRFVSKKRTAQTKPKESVPAQINPLLNCSKISGLQDMALALHRRVPRKFSKFPHARASPGIFQIGRPRRTIGPQYAQNQVANVRKHDRSS